MAKQRNGERKSKTIIVFLLLSAVIGDYFVVRISESPEGKNITLQS